MVKIINILTDIIGQIFSGISFGEMKNKQNKGSVK